MLCRVYSRLQRDRSHSDGDLRKLAYNFQLRRLARKLRLGTVPIRIVFLAGDPQGWFSMHSLYRACIGDPAYEVSVVNLGWGPWLGMSSDCEELFQRLNLKYIDGRRGTFRLESLCPDIVVTDCPYDQFRPPAYHSSELTFAAMLVYIPYGVDLADPGNSREAKQTYGFPTQRSAWRIFTRSPRTEPLYKKMGGIPASRIASLGLPILDLKSADIPLDGLPAHVRQASQGKFKVLYTPHHTLDGWSTFLKSGPHMRRILQESSDIYLVFRPHPGLAPKLEIDGIMSVADVKSYFPADRSYIWMGDNYFDAFEWSDVLVSDASSFLVQYAPTQKPVIYIHREDGCGIDDSIRPEIFEGYYVARANEDINVHLDVLKAGIDPLADVRHRCQERFSVRIFSRDAGTRIAQYLRESLS